MPTGLFSHKQAQSATARDFWLKPRKPFHPHGLKAQRLYGYFVTTVTTVAPVNCGQWQLCPYETLPLSRCDRRWL